MKYKAVMTVKFESDNTVPRYYAHVRLYLDQKDVELTEVAAYSIPLNSSGVSKARKKVATYLAQDGYTLTGIESRLAKS